MASRALSTIRSSVPWRTSERSGSAIVVLSPETPLACPKKRECVLRRRMGALGWRGAASARLEADPGEFHGLSQNTLALLVYNVRINCDKHMSPCSSSVVRTLVLVTLLASAVQVDAGQAPP